MRITFEELERFSQYVPEMPTDDSCWLWEGPMSHHYGKFHRFKGSPSMGAHRFAYELLYGEIPEGYDVHHVCENKLCLIHLEAVSRRAHQEKHPDLIVTIRRNKTHCPKGHEYTEENTYRYKGMRYCRECDRARHRGRKRPGPGRLKPSHRGIEYRKGRWFAHVLDERIQCDRLEDAEAFVRALLKKMDLGASGSVFD